MQLSDRTATILMSRTHNENFVLVQECSEAGSQNKWTNDAAIPAPHPIAASQKGYQGRGPRLLLQHSLGCAK